MAGSRRSRSRGRSRSGGARSQGGASRGGATRGGRRAQPARGGGGQGPTIIAILVVVGVVGAVIVFSSGKGKKEQPAPGPTDVQPVNVKPTRTDPNAPKPKLPTPKITNEQLHAGKAIVKEMERLYEDAAGLYDEASEAKAAGEGDLSQEALKKASGHMGNITDLWNEIVPDMPSNDDWDEEETANYYFGRVWNKINELKVAIRKSLHIK